MNCNIRYVRENKAVGAIRVCSPRWEDRQRGKQLGSANWGSALQLSSQVGAEKLKWPLDKKLVQRVETFIKTKWRLILSVNGGRRFGKYIIGVTSLYNKHSLPVFLENSLTFSRRENLTVLSGLGDNTLVSGLNE